MVDARSVFTSDRERRLWFWTLAVLVAIYASLGPARTLVDALRERNLLRVSFAVVVLAVVAVVVAQWAKKRPGWREIGVGLGVALAYGMILLRIENPAERTHLIEYGVVAVLMHQALLERVRNGRPVLRPAALTVAVTAMAGFLDEIIQAVLPARVFDWQDVFFNALAGFMAIVARLALQPVRLPGWRLWFLWLLAAFVGWGWSMDPSSFGEGRRFEILSFAPTVDVPRYLSVAVGGILVGVFQWLVLRRYLTRSLQWVLACLAASLAGYFVVLGAGSLDPDLGWLAGVGLYGLLAGVMQWLVLRRQVTRAGWWVPVSGAGWVAVIPVGDMIGPPGWAVFGAITGTLLVGLLRQEPRPDTDA